MDLAVFISTVADGNMLIPDDRSNQEVAQNRATFLEKHDISPKHSTRVNVTYNTEDFCRYYQVDEQDFGRGMRVDDAQPADALVTTLTNHALFLPLADCVGTVLYDPAHHVLMLSHLGRHSVEQQGGTASVTYLQNTFGSNPAGLQIWLTPAPGKDAYPMWAFENRSIKDVVMEQLTLAGVKRENITDNSADTTKDTRYFSHSEFLAGRRDVDGRHAIVAMMQS